MIRSYLYSINFIPKMAAFAICILLPFALPAQESIPPQTGSSIKKELLMQDFDSLHLWLKQTHPQLFFHSDSVQTERKWQIERNKIDKALSPDEFESIISPLVAQYNDGHTYIEANFDALQTKGACLFPVGVIIRENKIFLDDSLGIYPPGTELKAINGIKTSVVLKKILSMVPGDYSKNKEATAARLFPYYFGKLYGFTSRFNIVPRRSHSGVSVMAVDLDTYFKQLFPSPIWTMKLFEAYKLAVIECTNYQGKIEIVRHKLDSFFAIIKQAGIDHVAFDIRRNGGGNSYLGNIFLSYITQKPVNGIATKIYRQSPQLLKLKDTEWPKSQFLEALQTWNKNGGYLENSFGADSLPGLRDTSLQFSGRFYLLTSARTYSSAHITAMQVKCSKLGTIIGQPTGEDLNLTGEVIGFELPHTKIIVSCPVAMYKPACNATNNLGVQPDVPVRFRKRDLQGGKDSEIEALKVLIKNELSN